MQRIVTNETITALQEMVTESFIMTARIDRMQSVLDADLSYNQTSLLIHHGMAHRYSGYFADEVADLGLQGYDISVNYGDVPTMNKSYSSVKELLYELRDYVVEYQTELNGCYKIAFNNNDFHICADLIDIIKDHNNVVRQMILLCNKIDIYGDNPSFDAHIKDNFWILGENK